MDKIFERVQLLLSKARATCLRLLGVRLPIEKRRTLKIRIGNLTEAQAIAIEDMLRIWVMLSATGSSRWVAFYADGDGNFHPKILVDGRKPQTTTLGGDPKSRWKRLSDMRGKGYFIDFDAIAWALHTPRQVESKANDT